MSINFIFFAVIAIFAVASALVTILSKNPIQSALALIFHFFMLAGLYLTLQAQFVAVIQVLVYAGAIMVLVVFVIMLLDVGKNEKIKIKLRSGQIIGSLLVMAMVVELIAIFLMKPINNTCLHKNALEHGTIEYIGRLLFSDYILAIESIGILLLSAIVGAVILAKRKL